VLAKGNDRGSVEPTARPPGRLARVSWKIGRVARSHRCLGSHNGAHDSVIACGAFKRPNPHDATANRSILEPPVASTHDPAPRGGCEGLAMLSRMNLTLSALALSNGLNLGTRSLAANAGVNHGDQYLCTRDAHQDIMRDGMVWQSAFPVPSMRCAIPPIPSSSFPGPQGQVSRVAVQGSSFVVVVPVEPDQRPDNLIGRPERGVRNRHERLRTVTSGQRTVTKPALRTLPQSSASSAKHGSKRTAKRAARHAAHAIFATTGK
jgi:hypothetical protein